MASPTESSASTTPFSADQIRQRIADAIVGIATAAQAVGLEEHRRMLQDHAQRVQDSHAAMMRSLGYEVPRQSPSDRSGGIVITGDIHAVGAGPPSQATTTPTLRRTLPWLLAAAALVSGAGAGACLTAKLLAPASVGPAVESVEDLDFDVLPGREER